MGRYVTIDKGHGWKHYFPFEQVLLNWTCLNDSSLNGNKPCRVPILELERTYTPPHNPYKTPNLIITIF